MTATLQTILFVAGGVWGLAALTFVLALALAAARHAPDPQSSQQGKTKPRQSVHREHERAEQVHSV